MKDNPCRGCKAFVNFYRGKPSCGVFNGYGYITSKMAIKYSRKFSKNYCPCTSCLVKSICDNSFRISIRGVVEDIKQCSYPDSSKTCGIFNKYLRLFAINRNISIK